MTTTSMPSLPATLPFEEIARTLLQGAAGRSYEKLTVMLKGFLDSMPNFQIENNAVLRAFPRFEADTNDTAAMEFAIIEHSHFTDRSIEYLLQGAIRLSDLPDFQHTLRGNIDEELGAKTNNVPHLTLKRRGYHTELGIDVRRLNPMSPATQAFLARLDDVFYGTRDVIFLAGAFTAFEATAIREFHIVGALVEHYLTRTKRPRLAKLNQTAAYINGHKLFEIEHAQELVEAATPYVNEDNSALFAKGYFAVCLYMHRWWYDLASEFAINAIQSIK